MFRDMRRKNQLLPPEEAESILRQGTSGVLSLLGDGGYPYGVPLSYVYHNGRLYFHCAKAGHKLDAIRREGKCSFCVIAQDLEGKNFGDNDTLSAVVAGLCGAQGLIILTDIDGLYDGDPRKNPAARRIPRVEEVTPQLESLAGGAGSSRGTGGMATKLKAAKLAKSQGIPTAIVSGSDLKSMYRLLEGEDVGTLFPVP